MLYAQVMRLRSRIPTLAAVLSMVLFGAVAHGQGAAEGKASLLTSVDVAGGRAVLKTDGTIETYRYFRLSEPPRLVVDVYGVQPGFAERSFTAAGGFQKIRVGVYEDKTRLVFDSGGKPLPSAEVQQDGQAVIVSWQEGAGAKAAASSPPPRPAAAPQVSIKAVDFRIEGNKSILTVDLSGDSEVIGPVSKGNIVRFGVANASIDRSLRRTIDTSAFPSAILRVTPYTVVEGGTQEVRFATELKGNAPYELRREGSRLVFEVDNLHFAQAPPPPVEQQTIPVLNPAAAESRTAAPVSAAPQLAAQQKAKASAAAQPAQESVSVSGRDYRGEKISLVFDNADIRSILQLIGEVSNLNIIAGEAVKGTVTLRLVDVPWDQALELIMDTNGLGMLRDGNVVRILPKAEIRAMRQAELTAVRDERQLEPLTTEVISVSYSDLGAIIGPTRELLTDRGKITADARNKQVIVTDIAPVIEDIKRLVRILDTPERQVMIEARIVEANSNFSRDIGVRWGISHETDSGDLINIGLGGSFTLPPPAAGTVGGAGLASGITFGRVGTDSTILALRIAALENAGMGKVISTPRVTTLNGGKALISQGTKIPYQTTSDQGTETRFENAELKLEVSPVINPDNSVILDIRASNSSVGATVPTGLGQAIAIDEKKAETKVLVRDGETTVIGGIFVEDERASEAGVPLLMHIPVLGHLFKSTTKTNERRELLVFITPRILN